MGLRNQQNRLNNLLPDAKWDRLNSACSRGRLKEVREIVECEDAPLFINKREGGVFSYAPLHNVVRSSCHKKQEIIELLLTKGADPSLQCNGNYTPLHLAADIDDVESIKILLKFNADITMLNIFEKTALKIAEEKNFKSVAMHLKTAEVKLSLQLPSKYRELKKMIGTLQCGVDVTYACFDECLELTAKHNLHLAAGFIMFRKPDNVIDCIQKALECKSFETAAMLLLCKSATMNDIELITLLCCRPDQLDDSVREFNRTYSVTKDISLAKSTIESLRIAVKNIDNAFPVSVGCRDRKYNAVKCLLFNLYLNTSKKNIDWHGLALNSIRENWIDEIQDYHRIDLSYNYLRVLPSNISQLKFLKRLDLQNNKLESLPVEIFHDLPSLKCLYAQNNRIKSLPNIEKWTSTLFDLNLKNNLLKSFPENTIGAEIAILNLANNKFSQLPESVCNIKTLTELDISENTEIGSLPLQLGKLKNLNKLVLDGIQILDISSDLLKNARQLVRYMGAKLRAAKRCYIMKLMLIGKAGIGKTTAVHRLKGEEGFNENVATAGIDIQELTIRRGMVLNQTPYKFRVWDFAGQHDYYTTHQCFLSDCSIYLLVWDMQLKEKGLWDMAPWLDTLVARVTNCTVILVGTKLDLVKVDNVAEFENEMFKCADALLNSKSIYSKLIVRGKFHITSKVRHKDYLSKLENLKLEIYNTAESMTVDGKQNGVRVMGEKIPLSYIMLESKLDAMRIEMQKENKLPYINRGEFLDIVRNLNCDRDSIEEDEIDEVTSFLKKRGTILHYDDPHDNLKDLYFISPSWLCRLMSNIITVNQAHNFFENGILNINHIPLIIGGQNKEFPVSFYPKYLRLLSRFQIACHIDEYRILVPSKLPEKKPKFLRENNNEHTLLTRYHHFTCIPYGFWSRFMSRLLLLMHEMLSPDSKKRSFSTQFSRDGEIEKRFLKKRSTTELAEERNGIVFERLDSCLEGDEVDCIAPNVNGSISPPLVYIPKSNSLNKTDFSEVTGVLLVLDYSSSTPRGIGSKNTLMNSAVDVFTENNNMNASIEKQIGNSVFYIDSQSDSAYHENKSNSVTNDEYPFISGLLFSDQYCSPIISESLPKNDEDKRLENGVRLQPFESRSKVRIDELRSPLMEVKSQVSSPIPQLRDTDVDSGYVSSEIEVIETDCSRAGTCDDEKIKNGASLFTTPVDIACLIDNGILTCWQDGVIFNHPKLYFSIKQVPSIIENREAIETKVSKTPLGYRVLGFIVDHIKTLVREWYSNLSGTDGQHPYVMQSVPCPVCKRMNISPPHLFQLQDVFERIYGADADNNDRRDYSIHCPKKHRPQVVKVENLCPDLLFQDLPPELKINPEKLNLVVDELNKIGEGGYGKVYRCQYNNRSAAVKMYNLNVDIVNAFENFDDIRQEISMLSRVKGHPFIVEFFGFALQPKLCAVLELAEMRTLKTCLYNQNAEIDRIVIYRMVLQIAVALDFLHTKNIIHRDVKSDNVLLFSTDFNININVKLTDFGTTDFTCPSGMKHCVGTQGFIAPEMYDAHCKAEYTTKIDIYALAMLIYEIIARRRPFYECQHAYMIRKFVTSGERPKYKDIVKSMHGLYSLTELMLKMWTQESNDRPCASEVSDLISKPVFQFLYGKRGLELDQNPTSMCYVPNSNDVWIVCNDRKGAFLLIYNMITARIETLTIDGSRYDLDSFNIVLIAIVDVSRIAVILRDSFDVMLMFSTDKKRDVISHHTFKEEHVYSMVYTNEFVFLGFQSGNFSRIAKSCFIEKNKQKEAQSVSLNRLRSISAMIAMKGFIVLANDRQLFVYDMENLNDCEQQEIKTPDQPIRELIKCENEEMFFVSFQSSPLVYLIEVESLKILSKLDTTNTIKLDNPYANRTDIRVTCMCSFADVLWVGTGSGHILIYEHQQRANELTLLYSYQPYSLEVRNLCLTKLPETENGVDYLVLSSGKTLNDKMFGSNCFYSLNANFPVDGVSCDSGRNSPFQVSKTIDNNAKVVLIWQACSAEKLKAILEYPY